MKLWLPTVIASSQDCHNDHKAMKQLVIRLHEEFFEHDADNKKTMGIGFAISAACMLLVFGLYQL